MSYYRIGNFAQIMGVTPDFLKYYETEGILQPSQIKGSYRYYHFSKGRILQQCRGNRNIGLSIRDLKQISNGCSFEEYCEMIMHQKVRIQNEAFRNAEHLKWISEFENIKYYFNSQQTWYIILQPDYYFLTQSKKLELLDNESLCQRIKEWSEWLPCVQCTQRIILDANVEFSPKQDPYFEWGYKIDCASAERIGLNVESPVKKFSGGRYFMYPYITLTINENLPEGEYDKSVLVEPFAIMKEHNLRPNGEILRTRLFTGTLNGKMVDYYIIYIGL